MDFTLSLPDDGCAELAARARVRRVRMNVSVDELAARIGVSGQTLSHFERTGKCNLATFARILEALDAAADLQTVLAAPTRTLEVMRAKAAVSTRQRAYRKARAAAP